MEAQRPGTHLDTGLPSLEEILRQYPVSEYGSDSVKKEEDIDAEHEQLEFDFLPQFPTTQGQFSTMASQQLNDLSFFSQLTSDPPSSNAEETAMAHPALSADISMNPIASGSSSASTATAHKPSNTSASSATPHASPASVFTQITQGGADGSGSSDVSPRSRQWPSPR